MANNILHAPSIELKTAIDYYKNVYDSDKRQSNNKDFEQELKKLAWIQISSNAILTGISGDARNTSVGYRSQEQFNPSFISKEKLNNMRVITNVAKNIDNSRISGGFEEEYSDENSAYRFRPNVTIESIGVEYTGDLGSIIKGDIVLNCSTMEDFEIVNEFYANPSVSLIVQWGYNTKNGLKYKLNNESDYKSMWENPKKYQEIMYNSFGDCGALLVRISGISFSINTSGVFTVNLSFMGRGVSELFSTNEDNENLENSKSILHSFIDGVPHVYVVKGTSKEDEFIKKIVAKYPYIDDYVNDGFITLSATLLLFNEVLVDDTMFQFSNIHVKYNRFLMSNNLKNLKANFNGSLMQNYPDEWYFEKQCKIINKIDDLSLKNSVVEFDNVYLNIKKLLSIITNSKSPNDIINGIFNLIETNTIGDINFGLYPNINNTEFINNFTTPSTTYIPTMLITEKNYKSQYTKDEQPLNIPIFGKNAIVSGFDINGSLQDGLAQTVLYSKQEELGNTIGNLWSIKNDKYFQYIRKKQFKKVALFNNTTEKEIEKNWNDFGYAKSIESKNINNNYIFSNSEKSWLNTQFKLFNLQSNKVSANIIEAIFPLEINVDFLFGNTLFTYGTLFSVNYLPKNYRYDFNSTKKYQPAFYIKSTVHEITGFSWRTKITGALTLY